MPTGPCELSIHLSRLGVVVLLWCSRLFQLTNGLTIVILSTDRSPSDLDFGEALWEDGKHGALAMQGGRSRSIFH